jgi:hypothetical protein
MSSTKRSNSLKRICKTRLAPAICHLQNLASPSFLPLLRKRRDLAASQLDVLAESALVFGKAFSVPLVSEDYVEQLQRATRTLLTTSKKLHDSEQRLGYLISDLIDFLSSVVNDFIEISSG